MTREEASRRYQIPLEVLKEYESWELNQGTVQYNNEDLERLCLITSLKNLDFNWDEIREYLVLSQQEGTEAQRLDMLEQKRRRTLEEIHCREEQVCRLDCLRHNLRKKQQEKE